MFKEDEFRSWSFFLPKISVLFDCFFAGPCFWVYLWMSLIDLDLEYGYSNISKSDHFFESYHKFKDLITLPFRNLVETIDGQSTGMSSFLLGSFVLGFFLMRFSEFYVSVSSVCLAIERFIYICKPGNAKEWLSDARRKKLYILLAVIIILLSAAEISAHSIHIFDPFRNTFEDFKPFRSFYAGILYILLILFPCMLCTLFLYYRVALVLLWKKTKVGYL